jgi:hypothetical protein
MLLFAGTPATGSGRSATRRATDDCCRMRENPLRFLVTAGHERLELESDPNPATAT